MFSPVVISFFFSFMFFFHKIVNKMSPFVMALECIVKSKVQLSQNCYISSKPIYSLYWFTHKQLLKMWTVQIVKILPKKLHLKSIQPAYMWRKFIYFFSALCFSRCSAVVYSMFFSHSPFPTVWKHWKQLPFTCFLMMFSYVACLCCFYKQRVVQWKRH